MSSFLDALLRPRSVAIIGASDDPSKTSGRPQRYLARHGYEGRVYPVNPRRETVQGAGAWPSLAAVPEVADHAYVVVGTRAAIPAVEACAARGVKMVTVLADGFAEEGPEGLARQEQLIQIAQDTGMRLLGPNSMGVINCADKVAFSVNAALDTDTLLPGRLMAISQSGSIIGTLLSRGQARGIGFHSLISVGNEADLTVGQIGLAAVDDPEVEAFLLFLESIRNPEELAAFGRAAHEAGKPVIAYKLGRSEAGRELAVSHTGAITGSDAAADAFFRANGMVRVEQFESLFELPALLIGRQPKTSPRNRPVAVVTTTGGGGAMVVDRLETVGVPVAGASDRLREQLAVQGISLRPGRLTDVTLVGARYETMMTTLSALLDSGEFSAVIAAVGSSAQFHPELAVQPIIDSKGHATPLAAFMVPHAEASLSNLAKAGVPGFRTAETCADSMRSFMEWCLPAERCCLPSLNLNLPQVSGTLSEAKALSLFWKLGIETIKTVVLKPDDPIPENLGWPVVAKVLSVDVPHKTEVGGVVLGIRNATELAEARTRILKQVSATLPEARVEGIAVQPMAAGLAEALVGYRVDPEVGPTITVAMGGTLVEIYGDAALELAPVERPTAQAMIERVKGFALIRGYRGLPCGDIAALAQTVVALSRLASQPRVQEAEINPLIVKDEGEGGVAVDGLVLLK